MKSLKYAILLMAIISLNIKVSANTFFPPEKKTAEYVFALAESMELFDEDAFLVEAEQLSPQEREKLINLAVDYAKLSPESGKATIGEYILAVLIPPLAVGIHTDWEVKPVVSNILWTCLGDIPGIVHAFIVLGRD